MFKVKVLYSADEKEWLRILNGCENIDPHYLPGYLHLFEYADDGESYTQFGGQGHLFVYGDSRNYILYPFFKRRILDLPFADNTVRHYFDIVSPLGFGGPLANIESDSINQELWKGFYEELGIYCRRNRIISEFSRLNPLYDNVRFVSKFLKGVVEKRGEVVYIDLTKPENEIIAAMSRQRRSNIRKAMSNSEIRFIKRPKEHGLSSFFNLYQETMARKGVDEKYIFKLGFFERAYGSLGNLINLYEILYNGRPISAVLVIHFAGLAYQWFSCSSARYLGLRPNELCMYEAAIEAKKNDCKYYVLGGGHIPGDSLFRFKAGFSPLSKDFYIYKNIHLNDEYQKVLRLRNNYTKDPTTGFFPEYRCLP